MSKAGLTIQEVLQGHEHLTRDRLLFFERKGWIKPESVARGKEMKTRLYGASQLRQLYTLDQAYRQGLDAERIGAILADSSLLENTEAQQLGQALRELIECVRTQPAREIAAMAAQWGCRILDAECCLIFLESETLVGRMRLASKAKWDKRTDRFFEPAIDGRRYSQAIRQGRPPFAGVSDRGESSPDGEPEFATWIHDFHRPEPLDHKATGNLNYSELEGYVPNHLAGGGCHSWLSVPLVDRKGRVCGYIVGENRFGKDERPTSVACFDDRRQSLAEAYARLLGAMLDLHPLVIAQQRLLAAFDQRRSIRRVFKDLLRIALLITRGYRGEATLVRTRDQKRPQGLTVLARKGPIELDELKSETLPKRSVSYSVFLSGKAVSIKDTSREPLYHTCYPATKSQITVPIPNPYTKRPIGTINVESHQLDSFDRQDLEALQLLANQAGVYASLLLAQDSVITLFHDSLGSTPKERLQSILDSVTGATGYSGGIIYVADYWESKLNIEAQTLATQIDDKQRLHPFKAHAVATKVFFEAEPYLAEHPEDDPWINLPGYRAIGAKGPLLGMPVKFGDIVVGSMILWNHLGTGPTENDKERLKPYVNLVASPQQTMDTSAGRSRIYRQIRGGEGRPTIFAGILSEVCRVFDRGRIAQFIGRGRLLCLASTASNRREPDDKYAGLNLPAEGPFLKALLASEPGGCHFFRPNPGHADPLAHHWDRPAEMEFCLVPIFLKGAPWGYLGADNLYSRRPIESGANQEVLEVYGQLLDLAINVEEFRQGKRGAASKLIAPRKRRPKV